MPIDRNQPYADIIHPLFKEKEGRQPNGTACQEAKILPR
jgi:hypothetical protein